MRWPGPSASSSASRIRQLGFLFGDHLGPMGGGVTMGMLLCVPMMIVGLTYIVLAATGRTRPRNPVERPPPRRRARRP